MDWEQGRQSLLGGRVQNWRSAFIWVLAFFVAISNPLVCLVHCWVHMHSLPGLVLIAPVAEHAHHAHHAEPTATPLTTQPTEPQPTEGQTFCRSDHETPSPFTMAVFLLLLLLTFWIAPGFSLPAHLLFFLLPAYPPPRRPPRLAFTTLTFTTTG
jgi:hypothetical protein